MLKSSSPRGPPASETRRGEFQFARSRALLVKAARHEAEKADEPQVPSLLETPKLLAH